MTHSTAPIYADTPVETLKNIQARATVNILNAVHRITVAVFGLGVCIGGIALLVGMAKTDEPLMVSGLAIALGCGVYGALSYAFIGWFVESLALLTQIARNTAPDCMN